MEGNHNRSIGENERSREGDVEMITPQYNLNEGLMGYSRDTDDEADKELEEFIALAN